LPFVTYKGSGHGYLIILTNRKAKQRAIPTEDEVPVAMLYIPKNQAIALSDGDLTILKEQNHIGKDKLEEVPEDNSKPIFLSGPA